MKYFTFLNITLFHNTAYMYEYVYSNPPQHTQIVVPGFTLSSESKWELKKKATRPYMSTVRSSVSLPGGNFKGRTKCLTMISPSWTCPQSHTL